MDGRLLPCGESAVLVEVDGLDAVLALRAALAPLAGAGEFAAVTDVVPAATTLLLGLDDPAALPGVRAAAAALLAGLDGVATRADAAEPVEIGVCYDGADLAEVARLTGLEPAAVVAAHTGGDWTVAFGGFAPGFAYLAGGDERLRVPRRAEPRTRVPAGAVGLAGPFSGIYPRASPGGWQLIGRTDAVLWDPDRDPPALLQPGRRVRFRAIEPAVAAVDADPAPVAAVDADPAAGPVDTVTNQNGGLGRFDHPRPAPRPRALDPRPTPGPGALDRRDPAPSRGGSDPGDRDRRTGLTVLATGPLALPVDEGRPGFAAIGVGASGAADRASYRLGNRLAGNPPGAVALEVTLGGLAVRAASSRLVVLTGADCAPTVDGRPATHGGPVYLRAGQELRLGVPRAGLRTYLCVAGGFEVAPTLGSASADTLSGVGPPPVAAGDVLPVRTPDAVRFAGVDQAPTAPAGSGILDLDVLPGPRADWLADAGELGRREWTVSERSDRVGVRLTGDPLVRHPSAQGRELPSEPMVRGSIQVPPDGRPVIVGADHPVTGGYPVVGVLTAAASDALAQARPGQRVRLRPAQPR